MRLALEINDLSKTYTSSRRWFSRQKNAVKAVRSVNLSVEKGETLGIVGESGCGKSTLARMLVGLLPPSPGSSKIEQKRLDKADPALFGQMIQYVFQDALSSLNPRKSIRQSMAAPLHYLYKMPEQQQQQRMHEVFQAVGLREDFLERYPHELSGGQAQRMGIARALMAEPRILVLDEPVSALDVSVQAQVLNLLADLKQQFDLTYLFISHDLAVVEAVSQRVAVMYFGAIVEYGPAEKVFSAPRHPYTQLLAASAPVVGRALSIPEGDTELPDPLNPPPGCAFVKRCPRASKQCTQAEPMLQPLQGGQFVACYHPIET